MIIVQIWTFLITLFISIPIIIFNIKITNWKNLPIYFLHIPIAMFLCFWALALYYSAYNFGLDTNAQVRGIAAGFSLRFGILCGLILELERNAYFKLKKLIVNKIHRLFNGTVAK